MVKFDSGDVFFFVLAGIAVGFVIGYSVYQSNVEELGQAICEEEYDMNFRYYSTKTGLKCEGNVETDLYDGIKVKLIEDKN